jgi:hypothetical protein
VAAPALARRPVAAFASVVADGALDLAVLAAREAEALGAVWPDEPPWLCATSRRDLR